MPWCFDAAKTETQQGHVTEHVNLCELTKALAISNKGIAALLPYNRIQCPFWLRHLFKHKLTLFPAHLSTLLHQQTPSYARHEPMRPPRPPRPRSRRSRVLRVVVSS